MLNKMSTDTTGDITKTRDRKLSVRFTVGQTVIHYENIENLKVFINNRLCSIRQGGLSSRNKRKIRRAKNHGTTDSEGDSDSNFMFLDTKSLNGTIREQNSCNVAKDTRIQVDRKIDPARSRMLARHGHDQGRTMGVGRQTFRRNFSAPGQSKPFFSKKQEPPLLVQTQHATNWIWCVACRRELSAYHFCKGLNQAIRIDMDGLHFCIGRTMTHLHHDYGIGIKRAAVKGIRDNIKGKGRDPNDFMETCGIKRFDFQNIQQMSKHLLMLKDQAEEKKQNQLEQESYFKMLEQIYSQDLERRDTGQIEFKQLVTCFGMFDRKDVDTHLPCGEEATEKFKSRQQLEQQPRITGSDSPRTPIVKQTGTEELKQNLLKLEIGKLEREEEREKRQWDFNNTDMMEQEKLEFIRQKEQNLQHLKHLINNKINEKKEQAAQKTTRMRKKVLLRKDLDELSIKFKTLDHLKTKALMEEKLSPYEELKKQEKLARNSWTDLLAQYQDTKCALLQDEDDLADTAMKLDKLLALEQKLKDCVDNL